MILIVMALLNQIKKLTPGRFSDKFCNENKRFYGMLILYIYNFVSNKVWIYNWIKKTFDIKSIDFDGFDIIPCNLPTKLVISPYLKIRRKWQMIFVKFERMFCCQMSTLRTRLRTFFIWHILSNASYVHAIKSYVVDNRV